MNKKTNFALVGLYLLTCLLLAACQELSPQEIQTQAEKIAASIFATQTAEARFFTPTPTATTTLTPTPTPPATATPVPTPTPSPTPTRVLSLDPSQVLYLSACCSDLDFYSLEPSQTWGTTAQIVSEAFVGLTRQNEETSEVEPGMATSWDVSSDGLVWTFHLRSDVPWVRYNPTTRRVERVTDTSGQVRYVTAYDFEYGILRVLSPEMAWGYEELLDLIVGAEAFHDGSGVVSSVGVRALDKSTLEIRLTRPASYFDVIAGMWSTVALPEWLIEAEGEEWTETGNFQGYGPYVLKEWVHDSHLTLVKNPHWPGTENIPQPTIEEITWTLMDDDVALAAYMAGELDSVVLRQDTLASAQDDPQLAVQPNLCTYYYGFNTQKKPFDDPRVRLAFSLAVDRQALVEEVLQGDGEPARWVSRPGMRAAPTLENYPDLGVTYRPEAAKSLLDEVYANRSQMAPITLVFPEFELHRSIAEAIQAMWSETLEIEVALVPMNWSDYLDLLENDVPQIFQRGWCAYPDAHGILGDLFHSDARFPNYTNWANDEFDDLIDQAASSTDTAARTEWYAQAEDILVSQEAVVIPLYWYTQSTLTQPYIQRTYSRIDGIERLEKWAVLEH
ncbi:MAG: peptide ABC transporter substrate-binding protein [Anaerolineae bacterium]|nr:peptide ABC transporter substrate-binding protein [Anaerolineae bacterium]